MKFASIIFILVLLLFIQRGIACINLASCLPKVCYQSICSYCLTQYDCHGYGYCAVGEGICYSIDSQYGPFTSVAGCYVFMNGTHLAGGQKYGCNQCHQDSDCNSGGSCSNSSYLFSMCIYCNNSSQCPPGNGIAFCHNNSYWDETNSSFLLYREGYCTYSCETELDCINMEACSKSKCSYCSKNSDCIVTNICNPRTRTCSVFILCQMDADCGTGKYCNQTDGTCHICQLNSQCSNPAPICLNQICVGCQHNSECQASQICSSSGSCVNCVNNSECLAPNKYCTSMNTCIQCLNNSDCTGTAFCNSTFQCTNCRINSECPHPEICHQGLCYQCLSNTECSNPTPICANNTCQPCINTCPTGVCSNGSCVQCLLNSDCTSSPNFICINMLCKQCLSNSDCTGAKVCGPAKTCGNCAFNSECFPLLCSPTTHRCVTCITTADCPLLLYCISSTCQECNNNNECKNPYPICSGSHSCISCVSNAECVSPSVCSLGSCLMCALDTDCSNPNKYCVNNTCIQCKNYTDCNGEICLANHMCSGCLFNAECPTDFYCNTTTKLCGNCEKNRDCSTGLVCNTTNHKCVQCINNRECMNPAPLCINSACANCIANSECPLNTFCYLGSCLECNLDSDCRSPTPICNNNVCLPCRLDTDCPGSVTCINFECQYCKTNQECTGSLICQTQTGDCVSCLQQSDCYPGFCLFNGTCGSCLTNSECKNPTPTCYQGNCSPCVTSFDCERTGICFAGICKECQASSDCPASLKYCNTSTSTCVQCLANSDCTTHLCSANSGKCVTCLDNSECLDGMICNIDKGVCAKCLTNLECSNPTPLCVNSQCQSCSYNYECRNTDLQCLFGSCLECLFDVNCKLPTVFCTSQNKCVQCLQNSECETPKICNSTGLCAPCTLSSECPAGEKCDPILGQCYECRTNNECLDFKKPICINYNCENSDIGGALSSGINILSSTATPILFVVSPFLAGSFISVMQDIFYFMFFNVEYNNIIIIVLQFFSSGTFNFLPTPYDSFIEQYDLPSPTNFYKNGFSGLFLQAGKGLVFLYIIFGALYYLNHSVFKKILVLKDDVNVKFLLVQFCLSSYPQILIASLLQLLSLDFSQPILIMSSFLGVSSFAICILVPIWIRIQLKNESNSVMELVKHFSKPNFVICDILRKFLSQNLLVLTYNYPLIQTSSILSVNCVYFIFILIKRPFKSHRRTVLNLICEGLIIIMSIYPILIAMNGKGSELSAYIFLGLCGTIFLVKIIGNLLLQIQKRKKHKRTDSTKASKINGIEETKPDLKKSEEKIIVRQPEKMHRHFKRVNN